MTNTQSAYEANKVAIAAIAYRGFQIEYRPKPVPTTAFDWLYAADGYDGAPDSGDRRCGFAGSLEQAMAAVDELIEEAGA